MAKIVIWTIFSIIENGQIATNIEALVATKSTQ